LKMFFGWSKFSNTTKYQKMLKNTRKSNIKY